MSYENAPAVGELGSSATNGEENGNGKGGGRNGNAKRGNGGGEAQGQTWAQKKSANSRPLAQEEEWDDSELIRAWDAANAEYQALHGSDKSWKTESVPRSLLWESVPPPSKKEEPQDEDDVVYDENHDGDIWQPVEEGNAAPLDSEDHYLPAGTVSHPTLVGPPRVPHGNVSKDEAFQQVINSWYWAGYWTGVYSNLQGKHHEEKEVQENELEGEEAEEETEDMA